MPNQPDPYAFMLTPTAGSPNAPSFVPPASSDPTAAMQQSLSNTLVGAPGTAFGPAGTQPMGDSGGDTAADRIMAGIMANSQSSGMGFGGGPRIYYAPTSPTMGGGMPTDTRNPFGSSASKGSVGGYNSGVLQNLVSSYQKQSDLARQASQTQYNNLLASVAATKNAVESNLADIGKTGEANIARQQTIDTGKTEQDAVSRGLGNTTIRNQLLSGVTRNANDARTQLAEQIAGQKNNMDIQLGQMNGDAILSAANVAPSNDYLSLISQLAASGAGR